MTLNVDSETCNSYLKKVHDILLETSVYIEFYKQLFCYNQNRVEIINESAGTFFVFARNAIVESIVMRLSKLTDPSTSRSNSNLSVETLLQCIVGTENPDYQAIERQIGELKVHLKNVRDKRNKHLGHLDLGSFNVEYPITLAELSRAVKQLDQIFNAIIRHLPEGLAYRSDTTYVFEDPILDFHSDARAALIMLERGRRYRNMIESLSDKELLKFIPENMHFYGKAYFQHDILSYIDEPPEHEER